MNRASGHHSETLCGVNGQASACTEQSNFTPSHTKHDEYRPQSGSSISRSKVPLCVATSLGSLGLETQIPGCCSNALANQVVPDLGAPSRNAPTSGIPRGAGHSTPLPPLDIGCARPRRCEIGNSCRTDATGVLMANRVVWFTGLSGAGKTTIAMAAADRFGCEVLDGDTIRDFFSNTDFSREGRERHLLGVARMAKMISKHTNVICSFITPYEDVRLKILDILPENAVMVHISTSLEVCEDRDVKGLYAKARSGEIANFTGVTDPFDSPECAHLTLDSSGEEGKSVDDLVDQLSHLFERPKAVLLPGRWQPLHVGHEWLIQRELDQGNRVVVGIRDTPVTESDPYSAGMRKRMIEHRYEGEDVEAWIMPDIVAISYGRKVGYELREADDIPPEVFAVSATGVRGGNRANVSEKVMEFMISEGIWDGE